MKVVFNHQKSMKELLGHKKEDWEAALPTQTIRMMREESEEPEKLRAKNQKLDEDFRKKER